MFGLLRFPPVVVLVLAFAIAAYVVYHIASTGAVQPFPAIILVLAAFALVRSVFRLRRKTEVSMDEGD